ncbi:TPA: Flp family type IVb pilin [Vibrio metschnikovii]|uniref:Flp family type IVb pilin n=1 Tax=bacterium 19PA01SH03 TaxID=2920705 RepID=A0AAU6SQK3_UNCXX|nr:Flp family type IVb pilin [Vibrio metschnikovii]EKO3557867.1 Flp family type IVb pilin [Vibrio metschnikovii]EKO3626316.1 Flp family type IVb pilin [Vibrio metschnikovii]EKO3657969.1 Flp family type IVb pilin [Vibrio metschnikovii]EKO3700473.1 Flp family type IVb pilin [Vibrio metschnikovii]EKO3748850.1 Flp family type IVb pilin [Vibrio metschnikovii]
MLTKFYVKSRLMLDSFAKDQRGVTAIEYAIIGVAISAIVLAVFSQDGGLKDSLMGAVEKITKNIDDVNK